MVALGSDKRVTYRRRHSFNTRSNRIKRVKTPGGRISVHYVTKAAAGPKCGDCKKGISGVPCLRPTEYKALPKHKRTVSRAYGGMLCAQCTKSRVMRAFIVGEHKIVRKVLIEKAKAKDSKA